MKLLIITQKIDINDPILGFFHRWVEEFAKNCENVTVICLYKGKYDLPANVKVLSLGKEDSVSRLTYLYRFYRYIWQERKNYDSVFVHMNPIYIVLAGLFWKIGNKKISLWYTHKSVDWKLKLAERISNNIFTASIKSFRLDSNKVKVMGHGIDVEKFSCPSIDDKNKQKTFKIITTGRISPIKDYETLIKAVSLLRKNDKEIKITVDIIGDTISLKDEQYLTDLKKMVIQESVDSMINFIGPVPNKNINFYLCPADLFVNMSHTGSLDKAVLEAMACSLPVLTCNEAFTDILPPKENFFFHKGEFAELSKKIESIYNLQDKDRKTIGKELRDIVTENHNLSRLVKNIIESI